MIRSWGYLMPSYNYYCEGCGDSYEIWAPVVDRDIETYSRCQLCDGKIRRAVGCGGFQLKGGGWADTGYSKEIGNIVKRDGGYKSNGD